MIISNRNNSLAQSISFLHTSPHTTFFNNDVKSTRNLTDSFTSRKLKMTA